MMRRTLFVFLASMAQSAFAYSPAPGLWFNPNESGRGYNLDFQNGIMVVTTFIYSGSGAPLWFLSAGTYNENTSTFNGDLEQFSGGQCFGCPFKSPSYVEQGTLTIVFTGVETGTLYYPGGSTPIQHQLYGYNAQQDYLYGEWAFDINIGSGVFDTTWIVFYTTYTSNGTTYIAGNEDNVNNTFALGEFVPSLGKFLILVRDNVGYDHEYLLSGDDRRMLGLGALYLSTDSPPNPTEVTSGSRLLFKNEISSPVSAKIQADQERQSNSDSLRQLSAKLDALVSAIAR